jgi:hypothetical protein
MSRSNTARTSTLVIACTLLLSARTASAQEFVLHFRDGLVTLVTREVTVPTILTWWGRVGSATVVNGEKVEGPPVTLQLVDVPEREALAILLRNVGGYILAPRHERLQGVSVFDRILVLQPGAAPIRNQPASQVAEVTSPSASPESTATAPGVPGQSAEVAAFPSAPAPSMPVPGAQFSPQGNGTRGPTAMPLAAGSGTARPGEMTAAPVRVIRSSPGPQRPPQ